MIGLEVATGLLAGALLLVARELVRLRERVARLEGRLNGQRAPQ